MVTRARLLRAVIFLVLVFGASSLPGLVPAGAARGVEWKGAETLLPVALAPNVERCGPPPILEVSYAGTGIDTNGGVFAVTASGCLDLGALRVFDMEATDTYTATADSIRIEPDDFTLVLDPVTCVATNPLQVAFRVAGGTGSYEGAGGSGHFDFVLNHPACNGLVQPADIWFRGVIR